MFFTPFLGESSKKKLTFLADMYAKAFSPPPLTHTTKILAYFFKSTYFLTTHPPHPHLQWKFTELFFFTICGCQYLAAKVDHVLHALAHCLLHVQSITEGLKYLCSVSNTRCPFNYFIGLVSVKFPLFINIVFMHYAWYFHRSAISN